MEILGFLSRLGRSKALSKINTTPATRLSRFTSGAIRSEANRTGLTSIPAVTTNISRVTQNKPTPFWFRRRLVRAVEGKSNVRFKQDGPPTTPMKLGGIVDFLHDGMMATEFEKRQPERYRKLLGAIRRRRMAGWSNHGTT